MRNFWKEFKKGIAPENPILSLVLGLCPTLAVSNNLLNGLTMGAAVIFVLLGSNLIVSSVRKIIPEEIRLPCFIVIIATFVTIADLVMQAISPALSKALGIFVPLIVVNCIIMGRAEMFASKRPVMDSIADALGMGIGFTLVLAVISAIRELAGAGTLLGVPLINFQPITIMVLPPGALLVLGLLIGIQNLFRLKKGKKILTKSGCCH